MGSFAPTMVQVIFGLLPPLDFTDWWIGLYAPGGDPLVDLDLVEVEDSRMPLTGLYVENDYTVGSGVLWWQGLPAGNIQGWFVVNGEFEMNCSWKGEFPSSITVSAGDELVLSPGAVLLSYDDGTAVWTDPGGGGGGGDA